LFQHYTYVAKGEKKEESIAKGKTKWHRPNSKMAQQDSPYYSKDQIWRESHINGATYKQMTPSPQL
jgi:hypothetical protein